MTTRTDTFVGTAATDLASHTATGTSGGWSWNNISGGVGNATLNGSGQLQIVGTGAEILYGAATVGSNDQYAQIQVMAASDSFPVCVRISGTGASPTFYGARFKAGNWELWKAVASVFTSLGSSAATLTAGDTAKLQVVGTAITFSVNGSTVFSVTDSSAASGVPGLQVRSADAATNPWVENFIADAVSSGGGGTGDTLGMQIFRPNQRAWR